MFNIKFSYNSLETIIQCNEKEEMKYIIKRYINELKIEDNIYFIYNGIIINEDLKYGEIINEEDKKRKMMNILVYEINRTIIKEKMIKMNEIICPECKENILINIKDYKINLYNCKNNHKYNDILLSEYDQNIDISKIICNKCKIKNKSNIYNNEIYKCLTCDEIICPLCKSLHDKKHIIINYDLKNYICKNHNENYKIYCKKCNENICIRCEKEHINHEKIYFDDILPNINNDIKIYIDKLNKEINDIIDKLKNIMKNMKIYYNIYNDIIKNKNKNYEILHNINIFIKYNEIIIKDIKEIINDNKIDNKIKKLMNIYDKMNNKNNMIEIKEIKMNDNNNKIKNVNNNYKKMNEKEIKKNYIIAELNIKEDNQNIRIINTYEQYMREKGQININKEYENEKEIKENCLIKIYNKIWYISY